MHSVIKLLLVFCASAIVNAGFPVFTQIYSKNDLCIGCNSTTTQYTIASGSYLIIGDLTVNVGETLTLQPGVTFVFQGNTKLIVYGRISILGTVSMPVEMKALFESSYSAWGGLTVSTRNGGSISNLLIKHAAIGLKVTNCTNPPTINGVTVDHNNIGIQVSQWGALPSVTIANSVVINSPDYGVLITNSTSDIVFTNLTSKTNGQGMHLAGAVAGTILVTKSSLSFNYYEGIWILLAGGTLNQNLSLNIDSTSLVSNGILGFGCGIDYSRDNVTSQDISDPFNLLVNNSIIEGNNNATAIEFDQCYSCSVQVINSILKGNGGGIKSPTARQMNVVVDRSRFDANLGYAINLYASQTNSRITNSIFVNSAQMENSFYGLQFEFLIGLTPLQDDPDQRFIVTMTNNVIYRNNFTTTVGLFTNGTSGSQNNVLLSNNYFLENQGQDVIFQNDSGMSITRNYFNNPLAQCDITMRASIPNLADNRFWTSSNANLATTIRPILSNDFKDANALGAQLQTLPVVPNQSNNSASLMRTCRAPSNQIRLHGLGDTTSFNFSLNI